MDAGELVSEQLSLFLEPVQRLATIQFESTQMNPAFECGTIPYRWRNTVHYESAEAMVSEAGGRWPHITATIRWDDDGEVPS